MALFAKRVSEASSPLRITSSSATPCARAAAIAISNRRSNSLCIRAPDLDLPEPRRAGAVAGAHHLLRLPLSAVRDAPQGPVLAPGDRHAGVPELRRNPAVARILQHADPLPIADLPGDLAPELKVVPLVVDRPTAVGLHVNAVAVEDLVERLLTWQQADIGHADERQPGPAIGAHAAVGPRLPDSRSRLPRSHIPREPAVPDDVRRLCGHAFVVECEGPETGPM